jgi:CelD/BcsL family acetyltransferase involved in cellulose biosynthesis
MDIEVVRPSRMPADMTLKWRGLQKNEAVLGSPFLTPDWALAVERAHGERGSQIKVAVVVDGGRPRGFLAARVGAFTAMAAGAPMCDYQALVADGDVRIDPRRLVHALGVGRLDFTHMLADRSVFAAHAKGRCTSWIVDLSEGYETYVAERKAAGVSLFRDLAKKSRKAMREAGPLRFTAASADAADFERLIAWKRAQLRATGQVDIFAAGWPLRLIKDLHTRPSPDLSGKLFTLHFGETLAAAHFHLAGQDTMHAWIIAHEPRFERYSPGMLLFGEILRWMPAAGLSRLDLGAGDYRFKRQLANHEEPLAHGFVGLASPAALVRGAAYHLRRAAEILPLGAASALPGKAMRRLDVLRALR